MEYRSKKKIGSRIGYMIIVIILLLMAGSLYSRFQQNNFNQFTRSEYHLYASEFARDANVRYSEGDSYKIQSNTPNDAMFYQEIPVIPNTPYKVTCMVKTKEVETQKTVSAGGAHISIADTVEKSNSITGTHDWQKLEFIFNAKQRTSVKLGFRLGGYDDSCTGTVWFSDFTIEAGHQSSDTNWNVACFVFTNTNVIIENQGEKKQIQLAMTDADVADMRQNMSRFQTSCQELSKGKMSVSYDMITVQDAITSLSYDTENGYYVAPENVEELIAPYIKEKYYDHIFVCVRLGDQEHPKDIPVYDWIGLGGMDYLGIGFSNIRLPNNNRNYTYKYDARINTFPEEVFLHEFLHSLERNAKEYGWDIPQLHDYEKYGYQQEQLEGLKDWYEDYMNGEISSKEGYIGLPKELYALTPNHEDDFTYSAPMDVFKEPQNMIEKMKQVITKAFENVKVMTNKKEGNNIYESI